MRCSGTFRSYLVFKWTGFGSRQCWSNKRMKTVNYHKTDWKVKHTLSFITRTGTRHGTRITQNWATASRTQSWCGLHASTCGSSLLSTAFICTAMAEVGCPSLRSAVPSWWDRPLRPVNVIQACPGLKSTSFVGYKTQTRVLKQSERGGLGRLRGRVHALVAKKDNKKRVMCVTSVCGMSVVNTLVSCDVTFHSSALKSFVWNTVVPPFVYSHTDSYPILS